MKRIISTVLLFVSGSLSAESFLNDVQKIKQKIGEQEVDSHVKSGGKEPLPGEHLQSLMPSVEVDPTQTCAEDKEPEGTHYEVIFVAQGNTQKATYTNVSSDPSAAHKAYAENVLAFAAKSNLSEPKLAAAMAGMIRNQYASDEDRYNALAALSARLEENYNNARNPGFNNKKNNPNNKPLPSGDITLNQMTKAAFDWSKFDGGVCNDIAESVALVAEQLFPTKDVLIVNSGSHLGVVISDGKTNRIIDYGRQTSMTNQLVLKPDITSTNMRIAKVENGHTKQIAVVDTQTGQMMEQAFQTGKPLLKTNTDINSFVSHFKVVNSGAKKEHEVTVAAGAGDLNQAKMYVVVAKYEYSSDRWRNYVGVGGSALKLDSDGLTKYQLHFRAGSEFGIIRYATPKLSLNLTSGLQLEGMYGFKPPSDTSSLQDIGGNLDIVNRFDATYVASPRLKLNTNFELRHTVGPSSWGNATGAWAGGTGAGVLGTLGNMRFHLNQVNASAGAEYKISPKVTGFTDVKYQGSNVGQSLGIMGGVNIVAPKGAQILVFTGYSTTKLPGYDTKHSLLVGSNGIVIGAGLQTSSGISFTGTVRNLASDGIPTFEAGLSVPLGAPPKKYKSPTGPKP